MYSVYLIGALVLTGGAIAFIGDRLGTKIGKKRLSILGLRPRHTSMIVTVLTGICITVLTFAVLAALSENVRTALFGMERLNAKMTATQQELSMANLELSQARTEQEGANAAIEKFKEDLKRLKEERESLQEESDRLKDGNAALESENLSLSSRNLELAVVNDELVAVNGDLGEKNSVLTGQNKQLETDVQSLEKRAKELRDGLITMREGDIVFRAGEVLVSGVIRGGRSREDITGDVEALVSLAARGVAARTGVADDGQNVWIYQPEYDAAIEELCDSSKDKVVRLTAAGNQLKGEPVRMNFQIYENKAIYDKDEFIIARAYELTPTTDTEQIVMGFLREVNAAATAKGILPDPIRGTVGVIEGSQFYDVVQTLIPINGTIILSAYARESTDASGPLRLNLRLEEVPAAGR